MLALSQENNVKDIDLVQKSFEVGVIRRCGGDEKTNAKKKNQKNNCGYKVVARQLSN